MLSLNGSRPLKLQTRARRDIDNLQFPEYTAHRRQMEEGLVRESFRLEVAASIQRREASAVYNCHGMTFAVRRTGIYNENVVNLILADDGYRDIQDHDVLPGDIVLYYDRDGLAHSGVVVSNVILGATPSIRVLSKWGRAGEYIHDLRTHPYRGVVRVRFLREESDAR